MSWGADLPPRPAVYVDERGLLTIGGKTWAVALAPGDYTLTYVLGGKGFVQVQLTRPLSDLLGGSTELRVYPDGTVTVVLDGVVERQHAHIGEQ